jgi:hypothetical protein
MSSHGADDRPYATERHPYDYDWTERFPHARRLAVGEGWATFAAEADGAWWIIHDAGTLVVLHDDDPSAAAHLIEIARYDRRAAWQAQVDRIRQRDRRRRAYWRFRGRAPYDGLTLTVGWSRGERRGRHRVPLGQTWRSNETDEVIMVESRDREPVIDDDGCVHYLGILDEFGLLDLTTEGLMDPELLASDYTLLSDPEDPVLRWRPPGREDH